VCCSRRQKSPRIAECASQLSAQAQRHYQSVKHVPITILGSLKEIILSTDKEVQ